MNSLSLSKIIANLRTATGELRQDGRGWILVTVSAGWFLSRGVRYIYPALLPFLREAFAMDLTTAGMLLTMIWAAYAVGQFPGGIFSDRMGERSTLVFSTAVATFALLVVAASNSVWTLFLGAFAFGLATSLFGPARFTIFTRLYPERAGTAIGITMAAGNIGGTLLPPVAGVLASYVTWRLGFGFVIPLFLGVTLALWLAIPGRASGSNHSSVSLSLGTVRDVVRESMRGNVPIITLIQVVSAFAGEGFLSFYPLYLVEVKGLSPSIAATIFAFYFAFAVIVQPLAGMSRDRFGPRVSLMTLLGGFFLGLILLQFATHTAYLIPITALISIKEGAGVISNTYIADALPDNLKNAGLGLLRTGWVLIAALSPMAVGALADHGYFKESYLFLALLAGIGAVLTFFILDYTAIESRGTMRT